MILLKQAVRSVWRNKKAYISCVILMSLGIAVFVGFNLLYKNLSAAMNSMYDQQRFGDAFAAVSAMPLSAAESLNEVEGIRRADATIVADARVQRPDSDRIITLRLTSFTPGDDDRLNDFIVAEGSLPDDDGVLISQMFAEANGVSIGDVIHLVIDGKKLAPVITGFAQSPEYVYAIPGDGQLLPDDEAFGYGYMTVQRLGVLTGKAGMATNLSFKFEDGVVFKDVQFALEDELAPYGLITLVERKDQTSNNMLSQEIESLGVMAQSLPVVFILMAVIILYIMLKRIIEQERTQIGTLKAFGFSDFSILLHYMGYGGITGFAGGVAGVLAGLAMTGSMTDMYLEFFTLPAIKAAPDPGYLAAGFMIAFGSGLLGAFMGTRGILKLLPSEAMRPPAVPPVTSDPIGHIPLFRALLDSNDYMAVRNITRNKFRSVFVVMGIAFSFSITAFTSSYGDMFDIMMLDQFNKIQLYNIKLSLRQPSAYTAAVEAALKLDGARRAEGILEIPAEMRRYHLKKNISVAGVQENSTLYKIYDNEGHFSLPPPSGGMVISRKLADDLNVGRGDILMMRTPYTGDDDISVPVFDIINTSLSSVAYIRLDSLWELLDIPPSVNGVLMDTTDPAAVKAALTDADNVSAVTDQADAKKQNTDMMASYSGMTTMMQFAGVGIAFAIITNSASISLSERKREYATMRVLGMHPREIGRVVAFEYWTLGAMALPIGILLTRAIKQSLANAIDNDAFTMPVYTSPKSFLTAAALCGLAVILSNWSATRKIAGFEMVDVLKERE